MAAEAAGAKLAILEYTLAPDLKYPGQLAQASSALSFLLQHRSAKQIIVGGDSGGGNLTLALLAHIKSPHPRITPLNLTSSAISSQGGEMLRGAFCISPRCSSISTSASWTRNASKDIVGQELMQLFASSWEPPPDEVWATPICADGKFWRGVGENVGRTLVVAGSDEVYVDDIEKLAELIGAEEEVGKRVEMEVCEGEIHVQCVLDVGLGIEDGIMLRRVLHWLGSL